MTSNPWVPMEPVEPEDDHGKVLIHCSVFFRVGSSLSNVGNDRSGMSRDGMASRFSERTVGTLGTSNDGTCGSEAVGIGWVCCTAAARCASPDSGSSLFSGVLCSGCCAAAAGSVGRA